MPSTQPCDLSRAETVFTIERLSSAKLCIRSTGDRPEINLTTPSGKRHRLVPSTGPTHDGLWIWMLESTMNYGSIREVGRYRYEISTTPDTSAETSPTDSPATSSGEFVVGRASHPRVKLRIVGTTLTVTVAGVEARKTVYPSLFGPGPSEEPDKEYPLLRRPSRQGYGRGRGAHRPVQPAIG